MNLPSRVRIGHLDIAVRVVSRGEAERMGAPAWFDNDALEICIREDLPAPVAGECFVHESLHALFFASDNHGLTDEQEERAVRALSPFLLMALRDNPQVFAALIGAASGEVQER